MTTHTVNAHGVDPRTVTQAHAERVAAALGLDWAIRVMPGDVLNPQPGILTISSEPYNPFGDIVTLPWSLVAGLGEDTERARDAAQIGGKIVQNLTVAMQAAWIEWKHGKGAELAMQWIENTLDGPGHIPDEEAPWGKEAQAFFDANVSDALPACHCGRPSNQRDASGSYCSNECRQAAIHAPRTPNEAGRG
jgi:hypothetical protein